MTDIDTSIYKNTNPPPDILKSYGSIVGIQNAQQQNRLLQQNADMRAGLGDVYRQAVDPATGKVDQNRLTALASQNPATAGFTGEINSQGQANATATAQAQQEQLKSLMAHTEAANSLIAGTLGKPGLGKVDMYDDIVKGINDMASHGDTLMDPQQKEAAIASVPKGDPLAQKQWVLNKANENFAIQKQVGSILGAPQAINTGEQTQIVRTPVAGGAPAVAGSLTNSTSPETKAALQTITVPVTNPDGSITYQQQMVPRGTLPGASGTAGGAGGVQPPAAPPAARPATGAQRSLPGAPTNALTAPPAAPASAAPILAAPPPGVNESQGADVAAFKRDQAAIPTHATNVQSLQKAQTALEALSGPLGTGKGTDTLAHMKSVMSTLGIAFDESTLNRDEAKKYLLDYAKSQGVASHSDAQLNAALGSNASTDISNQAALDVVKTNIGRERQAIAQVQEHANPTGIGYGQHAGNFATKTDPRAFAADQYTPAELKKMTDAMKPAELEKFHKSLEIAAKYGLIKTAR